MRASTKAIRPILVSMLLALTGCVSLSRNAPPVQHYVLGGGRPSDTSMEPAVAPTAASVGLRTSQLADYLATPFIVVRRGSHRIEFSEYDRWGENLGRGIDHAVVGYLAARAPASRTESAPWAAGTQPDYVIQLSVLRFEGVAPDDPMASEGEAWLLVMWEITSGRGGVSHAQGTTERREPGWMVGDYDALVSLLDAGLDALSEELLRSMENVAVP